MKNRSFISQAIVCSCILFLTTCKKDEPYNPSKEMDNYFEGKVNGQEFELSGSWGCLAVSHTYYEDGFPDFDPPFPAGFFSLSYANCATDQRLVLGTSKNLSEGVFTSCDTSDHVGPWCTYADYSVTMSNGTEVLRADECVDIRLEIIRMVETTSGHGYIEGKLDATVRDSDFDTTLVVSSVKFGYKF